MFGNLFPLLHYLASVISLLLLMIVLDVFEFTRGKQKEKWVLYFRIFIKWFRPNLKYLSRYYIPIMGGSTSLLVLLGFILTVETDLLHHMVLLGRMIFIFPLKIHIMVPVPIAAPRSSKGKKDSASISVHRRDFLWSTSIWGIQTVKEYFLRQCWRL